MASQMRSAEALVRRALVEPGVLDRIQADPVRALQELAAEVVKDIPPSPPLENDVWIYRVVVGIIGFVALVAVVGAIYLALETGAAGEVKVPALLTAIGSGAVGALAGLLAPVSYRR